MKGWLLVALFLTASMAGCADDDEADDDAMDGMDGQDGMSGSGGSGGAGGSGGSGATGGLNVTGERVSISINTAGIYPINPGFDQSRIELPVGAIVELTFTNTDPNPVVVHDVVSPPLGAATSQLASGESETIEFTVGSPPGEYPFYCSVGNHRDVGMEGVFVVV